MTGLAALIAAALDYWLGEPRQAHPLVAFGRISDALERRLNRPGRRWHQRGLGALSWLLAVIPAVLLTAALVQIEGWGPLISVLALYLALGASSLTEHALVVRNALARDDLGAARDAIGRMVSRDTRQLSEPEVAAATVESVLENGNDAVFGTLFWFAVAGAPGAVLYRLANTLDAMWGYRNERFRHFGWAAARLDDALNLIPARLTALSYALLGNTRRALRCWRRQARAWKSPNAGPVMAAGAGALGVQLGGLARYQGLLEERPALGEGDLPDAAAIERAVSLVRRTLVLWLAALLLGSWLYA